MDAGHEDRWQKGSSSDATIFAPARISPRGRNPEEALNSRVYLGKHLQLEYTVSMPEKIPTCLNRGREESVGNDDVSVVCARKYEMVRMT